MSNLLSQASLVMIPSGYKEDVVYSQIPTSGAGDLSFTRASNGTRINSAGLVEVVPWNLLSNSEQFTSANGWFPNITGSSTATQTSDYGVAPNGTTTADRIQLALNGSSFADWVVVPTTGIIVGQVYTYSIYIKSLSGTKTILFFNDSTVNVSKTITIEWVRYEYSWTATSTTIYPRFLIDGGTSSSVDLLAWGYQINIGSTAKPYFPTTDRLNVPRLTYQNGGGGCPSLLLEKQSTNEANYSQQFDDSYWAKNNQSVTANATTSPDGTQNADLLIPSAGTGDHYLLSGTISNISGQVVTLTLFVKKKENDYFYFGTGGASAFGAVVYQFSTNTFVVSGLSATATNFGNGWIRLSITGTTGATDLRFLFTPTDSTGSRTYNANGTDGTYIWGAQAEASSYPTSYIPTTSSSATRVADACFKTGISSLIGQTEGVLFADINPEEFQTGSYIGITDGTVTNRIIFGFESGSVNSGTLQVYGISGVNGSGTYTRGQRMKIALAYKSGNSALYVNGSLISTATTTFTASFSQFRFDSFGGTQNFIGKVNEAILFPTRLTNAELASLTTI